MTMTMTKQIGLIVVAGATFFGALYLNTVLSERRAQARITEALDTTQRILADMQRKEMEDFIRRHHTPK